MGCYPRSQTGCVSSHCEEVRNGRLEERLGAVAYLDSSTAASKTAAASSSVFDMIRARGRLSSVSLGSWCLE